jgi:hypothetical protein
MKRSTFRFSLQIVIIGSALLGQSGAQTSENKPGEEAAYSSKFFQQLGIVFGRFRDYDLERAFRDAMQIQCSELLGRSGEWRPVAFFNEDRDLGNWYRANLAEVKADLTVYTFKGSCAGKSESIRVETRYPVAQSLRLYRQRKIELDQVEVRINDPANAGLNRRTRALVFDLPYLFLDPLINYRKVYTLYPPDHDTAYAKEEFSRWECKTVAAADVTYRFLICRVSMVPRKNMLPRGTKWERVFGSSACYILSDGMEAKSSIKITFEH